MSGRKCRDANVGTQMSGRKCRTQMSGRKWRTVVGTQQRLLHQVHLHGLRRVNYMRMCIYCLLPIILGVERRDGFITFGLCLFWSLSFLVFSVLVLSFLVFVRFGLQNVRFGLRRKL